MDLKRKRSLPTSGSSSKSEKNNEKRPETSVEMKRSGAEESQPETVIKRRKNINDGELLSAARENNLNKVKCLISEEAGISFVDEEGNTALHHAVRNHNAEIVKLFLNYEKVDDIIHVVNKKGATALGIARQLNKKFIVEKLENKILNDSFKNINSLSEDRAVTNSVCDSNSQVEPHTKDKIKRKIEICLQALKELTESENDIKRFTYKSANVFLFFLETFALADLEQDQDERDTFIDDCIGKEDNDRVKDIRNYLMHRKSEESINPTYLQNFVEKIDKKMDTKRFFCDLRDYTQGVYDKKWNKWRSESNQKNLTEILKPISNPPRRGGSKKQVLESFRSLVIEAYTKEQNPEKIEKIMFDLIVNIIPLIGEDLKEKIQEVNNLRNDLIHNFHRHENLNSRILKIKETIFNVRSKAFHYYISGEIHNGLSEISLDADCSSIEDTLNNKLRAFEKKFNENQQNEVNTLKESEVDKSFEYVLSQPLFGKDDRDVETSVGEYFKFMIIIDYEKREEENQINDEERSKASKQYKELYDAERREIFEDFIKLKKLQTSYDNLDEIEQRQEASVELKRKLGEYGVREDHIDEVIKLYIEADNIPDEQVVNKVVNIIKSLKSLKKDLAGYQISSEDIASLYERFTKKKKKCDFRLNEHKDLLKNYRLTDDAKELIDKNLNSLPRNEILDISIGGKNIQIRVFKVVNNILRTFYNAYHKYQTEFTDVKALFEHEIFLDYLVSRDIIKGRGDLEFKDKNRVFVTIKQLLKLEYTAPYVASLLTKVRTDDVIQKHDYIKLIEILLKKDSYIAYLNKLLHVGSKKPDFNLYEVVYNRILETDDVNTESLRAILDDPKHANETLNDYIKLTEILVKNDSYITDLNNLYADSEKPDTNLEDVCNRILEKNSFNIESMRVILDDPKHANESLNVLGTKIDSLKDPIPKKLASKIKDVLELLNNIALKLIYKGKHEEALKILSDEIEVDQLIYTKLKDKKLIESDDSIIIERKLNIAKAKAAQGRENNEQDKFKEALKVLEEIPDTNFPLFLLALSRKAFIHNLLKEYDNGYEGYDSLYKEIEEWVDVGTTTNTKEIITKIKKSREYQSLLAFSNECKRYLNIVNIKMDLAYSKSMQGNKKMYSNGRKGANYKEALDIYNEVYNLIKEDSEKEYENSLPILPRVATIHSRMGKVLFHSKDYLGALEHYYTALAVQNRILERTRKIYGDYYQNTERAIKYVIIALENIARADITLGSQETLGNYNRARKYYEALEIYQQICQFERRKVPKDDECVAKLLDDIASIYDKLSRLKSSSNPKEALTNCDKMIDTYEEVIRIRKNPLVKNEGLLKNIQTKLEQAERWRKELLNKQQKNKVSAKECLPSTSGHNGTKRRKVDYSPEKM